MAPLRFFQLGVANPSDPYALAIKIVCVITAGVLLSLWAAMASAQDTLDPSILAKLDAPTAAPKASPGDALDLSLLDRLDAPVTTAADALDLTLLDDLDRTPGKPAVKPSKAALRSLGAASGVELGCEIGRESCRPEMPQASVEIDYPTRGTNWSYPGVGRSALIQHLTTAPQHRGKFQIDTLARLETNELQALHSDDHEGRKKPITIVEAPRPSAATCPNGACPVPASTGKQAGMTPTTGTASPPSWGNVTSFGWLDGSWRSTPQPGTNYPTLGGVLVPLSGGAVSAPQALRPIVVRGGCPGGVCPTR